MENNDKKGAFIWDLIKFCLISLAIVLPFRLFVAQPFIVSGLSMFPTFDNGQYLIVDELSYRFKSPERGDVIIFHFPNNTKEYFIKRIIGLPGETVSIVGGKVKIVNTEHPEGFLLTEPYIEDKLSDIEQTILDDSHYYVMGDNRDASYDSRSWGSLSKDLIVGRAFLRLVPFKDAGIFPGKYQFTNE
ncbi:MAG: signal peptidase I [Candidatus Pacebacteria bacterium]|nr:signal peptidase I [Candidatus Paceibacterota bacterium]MBP9852011.1 signal peptidase I [Candidatus Paceibacterota bacterium]